MEILLISRSARLLADGVKYHVFAGNAPTISVTRCEIKDLSCAVYKSNAEQSDYQSTCVCD